MSTSPARSTKCQTQLVGFHRGVRYTILARPGLSTRLIALYRISQPHYDPRDGAFWPKGRRYDRGTGRRTVSEAVLWVHCEINKSLDPRGPQVTLEEFVADYLRELEKLVNEGMRSAATLGLYRPRLRRFVKFCRAHGVERIDQLGRQVLADYRAYLLHSLELATSTVNSEQVTTLSAILKRAHKQQLTTEDLTGSLPSAEQPPPKKVRELSRAELAGIFRAMHHHPDGRRRTQLLRFVLWTGCRNTQARKLARDQLHLAHGTATLIRQKPGRKYRGKPHEIPLTRRAARMLSHVVDDGTPYVFGLTDKNDPVEWLREAAGAAGVACSSDPGSPNYLKLHHIRDTFASQALNDPASGMGLQDVMEMCGWSNHATALSYKSTNLKALRVKLETLR